MPISLHYMAFRCQLPVRVAAVERTSVRQSELIQGVAQASQYHLIHEIHK